ncbi:MAG: hypothetical protein Q8N53_02270 [Longimicrobiales bacterium]|nr:hypothetical protein [Longimicrobiales bacterium]
MSAHETYDERRLGAYHESGHVVAATLLGGKVQSASVHQTVRAADCPLGPWSVAVLCLAGAVAAQDFGPKVRSPARSHSEQDLAVAEHALEQLRMSPKRVGQAEWEARQLLAQHSWEVHSVARALLRAGSLDGNQVARLMAGERVDAVVPRDAVARGDHAEPVAPAPTQRTADTTDALRVPVRTWQMGGQWWEAAARMPTTDPRIKKELLGLICAGDTLDQALDAFGEAAVVAIGGPVVVVTTEDAAA